MSAPDFAFYLLSAVLIGSGIMSVTARSAVHCVLWLLGALLCLSGLFLLLGAPFVALLLLVLHGGGVIGVLYYVISRLKVSFAPFGQDGTPFAIVICSILGVLLYANLKPWEAAGVDLRAAPFEETSLAVVVFENYALLFGLTAFIMLAAILGAIMVTLRHAVDTKRQTLLEQLYRDPDEALKEGGDHG